MSDTTRRTLAWSLVGLLLIALMGAGGLLLWRSLERRDQEAAARAREHAEQRRRELTLHRAFSGDRGALSQLLASGSDEDLSRVLPAAMRVAHPYSAVELQRWVEACGGAALPLMVQQLADPTVGDDPEGGMASPVASGFPSMALRLREQLDPGWTGTFNYLAEVSTAAYRGLLLQEARALAVAGGRHWVLAWLAPLLQDASPTRGIASIQRADVVLSRPETIADRALEAMTSLLGGQQPWKLPAGDAYYDSEAWRQVCEQASAWWAVSGEGLELEPRGWIRLRVRGLPSDAQGRRQLAVCVEGSASWSSINQLPEADEACLLLGPYAPGAYTLRVCDGREGVRPDLPGVLVEAQVSNETCHELHIEYTRP